MTKSADNSNHDPRPVKGWVHFGIAVGILSVATVGWSTAIRMLQLVTHKEPVPWPAGVVVNPETMRLMSLPDNIAGRFVMAEDGELTGKKDGQPDGEIILKDDEKEILGIGTSWDRQRLSARQSNWHVVRIYRDNNRPVGDQFRYWRLEVCYYTGRLDTVPHVPERCLTAGGWAVQPTRNVSIQAPSTSQPWNGPLTFKCVPHELTDRYDRVYRRVTYYIFSLNGTPEGSWEKVRFGLSYPKGKYCYFAKIQFGPEGQIADIDSVQPAAEEFMSYFLPPILKSLPMPSDMKALESGQKNPG